MAHTSPLMALHSQAEASTLGYGSAELGVELVETFGELDFEYAALRKGCVLLDLPHRGTIELRGDDRRVFLNNLITQQVEGLEPFRSRRSFWLNRKGRIEADLRVTELGDRIVLDLDVHAVEPTVAGLEHHLFSEDVTITDVTDRVHRLALHGPTGPALLAAAGTTTDGPSVEELAQDHACVVEIAGTSVLVERQDTTGEVGLELSVETERAEAVYRRLVELGEPVAEAPDPAATSARIRMRRAGWLVYNTARIEAGTPIFNIDFGSKSLPAETGVLRDRVSFTKGCYLGQEVVARMDALGHPKQVLVGLRVEGAAARDDTGLCRQPVGGAQLFEPGDLGGNVLGAITSSTISPMLGGEAACLASVGWASREAGTRFTLTAEGVEVDGVVQNELAFYTRPGS